MTACQPPHIYLTPHNPTVGAGLPAMTAYQPTSINLIPHNPTVCGLAREGGLRSKADQDQERLASHRGYRWVADLRCLSIELPPSQASQLPQF